MPTPESWRNHAEDARKRERFRVHPQSRRSAREAAGAVLGRDDRGEIELLAWQRGFVEQLAQGNHATLMGGNAVGRSYLLRLLAEAMG